GKEAAPGQLQAQELIETYNFHDHDANTEIYGLIGNPLEQSPSHQMHNAFFKKKRINAVYVKMPLLEEELPLFFKLAKQLRIRGLSVTMPFKEKLFDYIDCVEEKAIGAVNTLILDEKITGANTDGQGALDAIGDVANKRCVIIGDGGASKAIAFEAKRRGAHITIISRRAQNLENIPEYDILINTTPVACPIDLSELLPRRVVMDINVLHTTTPFMLRAKALGCRLIYGLEMFERQAHGQFLRWGQTLSL
nr:Shikimate dehydrogenase (NADP(+)) [Chlamydiota bacterium]